MKISPFLSKKLFGFTVNDFLTMFAGIALADSVDNIYHTDSLWLQILLFAIFLFMGMFIYTVIISLIKTYITKED